MEEELEKKLLFEIHGTLRIKDTLFEICLLVIWYMVCNEHRQKLVLPLCWVCDILD